MKAQKLKKGVAPGHPEGSLKTLFKTRKPSKSCPTEAVAQLLFYSVIQA